jgi:recombination protein RecR
MADLRMAELLERVAAGAVREVLLAANASGQRGQTTALYVTEQLKPTGVRMTRLAFAGVGHSRRNWITWTMAR